ncbi:MAG: type II toxin-antitoxin system HicB family antitoxin [Gammaproteobacteria bacterium]
MLEYKGYIGHIEYDEDARILHGEVLLVRGVITFQGESVHEIENAFHDSVDDYLQFCKSQNIEPEKPLPVKFLKEMGSGHSKYE